MPQVNAQVIGREEQLAIRIDRYRVNVVRVRVGIHPLGNGRVYSIFVLQLQMRGVIIIMLENLRRMAEKLDIFKTTISVFHTRVYGKFSDHSAHNPPNSEVQVLGSFITRTHPTVKYKSSNHSAHEPRTTPLGP